MTDTGGHNNPRMAEASADHPALARRGYFLEAWRGHDCIGWRYMSRPSTVANQALVYQADGADRMYVRWTGPNRRGVAADWAYGSWRRVDDPMLADSLGLNGCAECDLLQSQHGPDTHAFVAYQAVRIGR
jgi:hypothetical protein